jgi:hypothetical protein
MEHLGRVLKFEPNVRRVLITDQDSGFFKALDRMTSVDMLAGVDVRLCAHHAWDNFKKQLYHRRQCMTPELFQRVLLTAGHCQYNAATDAEVLPVWPCCSI